MKPNFVKDTYIRILKSNKRILILLGFLMVCIVIVSLIPPQILKSVIDNNLTPKRREGLFMSAMLYFISIFAIGIFEFVKETLLTILGQRITKEIRIEMMEKLKRMKMNYFSNNGSGTIVSQFTNDVESIQSMFTQGIAGMFIDSFTVIGIIVSIWWFHKGLGVIIILLLPILYFITRTFQKKMLQVQIQNRILIGKVNNHIAESLKNIKMIKSYSKEKYMEDKYVCHLKDNVKTIEKVNFFDSIFPPVIQMIRAFVIVMIILISSKGSNYSFMTLGMVAASIDLISNLFNPIEQLGMELQNIQQAISGVKRVNAFFKEEEDKEKILENTRMESMVKEQPRILEFHNLNFQYEEGHPILTDMNLKISGLERVTFVGRTGVGKSTLFKLILGLIQPTSGRITLNGIDVYQIPNHEKRKIFGYVEQNFHMIQGTVAEQISLREKSITMDQIKQAIGFVGMSEYVESLENGYDTVVTNKVLFSQGQKQLLGIARAIVTKPPILLLDEMTANLDSVTEEKIVTVLQKAEQNYMLLSITHRLSSLCDTQTIVVLEEGKVRSVGKPDELYEKDEWYRREKMLESLS